MKSLYLAIISLFVFELHSLYGASNEPPIPVEITQKGDDALGSRLVFQLKESVRSSKRFVLVDKTVPSRFLIIVSTQTVDPPTSTKVAFTAIMCLAPSPPEHMMPQMFASYGGIVGFRRLTDASEGILDSFEVSLEDTKTAIKAWHTKN